MTTGLVAEQEKLKKVKRSCSAASQILQCFAYVL